MEMAATKRILLPPSYNISKTLNSICKQQRNPVSTPQLHPCRFAGMGGAASRFAAPMKQRRVERDLDNKVVEALRERARTRKKTFKSVNSITMRLPRFKDGLRDIRDVFDHYDGDSNGSIDNEELRRCLRQLQVQMSEKEVDDVHRYCDIDNREGIQFQEFVVLLCLMYLLFGPNVTRRVSEFESAKLNYVFDELIDAFLFFNKEGDGKMRRKDVTQRMNEASHQERTPSHITTQLFKEMDLDRNGKVNLKEFLFAMIRWAGLETDEDDSNDTSP
ncbi:probable calcium-binding protein CML22 isoform X1 [Lolium rigidum]|uniref:probable calcium-binding protein CML22 isoform X1 n=2 Tax=Lolium rigidum TaxID=89674 RepID=UPI001F5E28E5|nr:probable calcium-binding protein CML22 isoform X1 [Lolium rigidum]